MIAVNGESLARTAALGQRTAIIQTTSRTARRSHYGTQNRHYAATYPGGPDRPGGAPGLYQRAHRARAIGIAVQHYPDTCRALENAEADRDQARRALQQILDALDEVDNAQSSLHQVIQGLCQRNGW